MGKKAAPLVELDPSMRLVVLYGKERFLIEEHTRRFAESLVKKFGGLEQFHMDGQTVQPATVLDELRSYGLMQKHKLVILDHAEVFLAGGGKATVETEDGEIEEDIDESTAANPRRPLMERYAENPVPDATLLMRATGWRAGKLDKLILKSGGAINHCEPPTEAKAVAWCMARCEKRYEAKLQPEAAELLVARIGTELQHLDTELMKLAVMAGQRGTITRLLVSQAVGLSREEKAWEIQSAVLTGNATAMLRKLRELVEVSRQDAVPITWAICDLLRKLHAAAQLLRRGVPRNGVMGQLKLWGNTVEPILAIAGRSQPAALAQLLQDAIETDRRGKTGQGDPVRNVESLMVRIADVIHTER